MLKTSFVWQSKFSNFKNWLRKSANIKYKNNSAVVYVGTSLTVHNPLLCLIANCYRIK